MKQVVGACSAFLVLTAAASGQTPVGGEFRVNTYTTGGQGSPRAAMQPDGNFVVVWTSEGQDGDRGGIFGQRFAADGARRGTEFRANTHAAGNQRAAAVAVGGGGEFVVVWESGPGFSSQSIRGQLFDSSGNHVGGEFQVNAHTTGFQGQPRVARATDGSFVVTWSSYIDGTSLGVAARQFDASGNAIGREFAVNTQTIGAQGRPDVAFQPNGTFVVVWQGIDSCCYGYCRFLEQGCSGGEVSGRLHDASANPLGSEFQVNEFTTGGQAGVSVSASPRGGFVVAWDRVGAHGHFGIFARRFDASGSALGNDLAVNTYALANQSGAQVAHDARGNFVVTWVGPDGSFYGGFAQRFAASGARRGIEFVVNAYTTGRQGGASVASDATGNFVVAWHGRDQDGSDYGVFAQRFGDLIFEDGFDPGDLSRARPTGAADHMPHRQPEGHR